MIGNLIPYRELKESGFTWMKQLPSNWRVLRGKFLFHRIDIRSADGAEDLLSVSSEAGVVRRSSAAVTMFEAESYVGYKLCWPEDLVINSLWAWAGGLGVSQYYGIVSSAYGVYRLRHVYHKYSSYIHWLARSEPFNFELRLRSKEIWISRLQLTDKAFLDAPFPIPPEEDRSAIVRFLDQIDRRIRRYIRGKQKLIALLEERKQIIMQQAVTGKIDVRTGRPYTRCKSSGITWLGKIPERWTLARLKDVAVVRTGLTLGQDYTDAVTVSRQYLRVANVQDGHMDLSTVKTIALPPDEVKRYVLADGDVLMTEGGDIDKLGRRCVWRGEIRDCLHQNHIFAVRSERSPRSRFSFSSARLAIWKNLL